jgi:hypothetical protein
MSRINVFPYLRAGEERVKVRSWQMITDKGPVPLENTVDHWDSATALQLGVEVEVDIDGVWADCDLHHDDTVRLGLVWRSPGTAMRGSGVCFDLAPGRVNSEAVVLDVSLEGGMISERVRLGVHLLLGNIGISSSPLAPHRAGSLLWSVEQEVLLEGQAARFPMEVIDFALHSWMPADAAWFLDWNPDDLNQTVLGSVRLFINSRNQAVAHAVTGTDPVDMAIREAIRFDVARLMIEGILGNPEFISRTTIYDNASVGATMLRLVYLLFPGYSPDKLSREQQIPARFEGLLQERLKLFQGVAL